MRYLGIVLQETLLRLGVLLPGERHTSCSGVRYLGIVLPGALLRLWLLLVIEWLRGMELLVHSTQGGAYSLPSSAVVGSVHIMLAMRVLDGAGQQRLLSIRASQRSAKRSGQCRFCVVWARCHAKAAAVQMRLALPLR